MKYAIITDNHAGCRNDSAVFLNYTISFFTEQFIPYLLENKITHILHLGDVFDRRKYINFNSLYEWRTKVFDVLKENNIQMYLCVGNHDCYFKNTNDVSGTVEFLKNYSNIYIYSEPTDLILDDIKIFFVPWIPHGQEETFLYKLENTTCDICMGHLEIKGFEMHIGHLNEEHGLDESLFNKFDMVMSGHYHHKSSKGNIHYLGSPYQITWNDWGDDRGFHIFNTKTRNLEFIKNSEEIFKKVFYNDLNKNYYELFSTIDFSELTNKHIKLIVEKKDNVHLYEQFLNKIYLSNPADVSIIEQVLYTELENDNIDNAKDTLTILKDYVSSLELDCKDKLNSLFSNLYHEAITLDIE